MLCNILLDKLPQNTPNNYKIKTSYKQGIKFELLMQDNELSKEEQAIQMAMDQYGPSDEEIYFSVDAVDAEGRYIVSVHELETTFLMTSYVVDLEKQTVTEQ